MDATRTPLPATVAAKLAHAEKSQVKEWASDHARQLTSLHTIKGLKEPSLTDVILVSHRKILSLFQYFFHESEASNSSLWASALIIDLRMHFLAQEEVVLPMIKLTMSADAPGLCDHLAREQREIIEQVAQLLKALQNGDDMNPIVQDLEEKFVAVQVSIELEVLLKLQHHCSSSDLRQGAARFIASQQNLKNLL